jgi:hypothetical protein
MIPSQALRARNTLNHYLSVLIKSEKDEEKKMNQGGIFTAFVGDP